MDAKKIKLLAGETAGKVRGRALALIQNSGNGFLYTLFSFALAQTELTLGAFPFGVAFLCAVASEKLLWFSYVGCMLGAIVGAPLPFLHMAVYTALMLGRLLLRRGGDDALSSRKIWLSSVGALLIAAGAVLAGGYSLGDLLGVLIAAIASPLLTFLFAGAWESRRHFAYYEASLAALAFAAVFSVRDTVLFGLEISVFLSFLLTFYISYSGGSMRGAVAGIICGIACEPIFAPVYAIAGLLSGLLWQASPFGAICGAGLVGIAWGVYADGITAVTRLLPEFVGTAVLYYPMIQFGLLPRLVIFDRERTGGDPTSILRRREEDTKGRLARLSDSFGTLSEAFLSISSTLKKPATLELRKVCVDACDAYCRACTRKSICHEREKERTEDAIAQMTAALRTAGKLSHGAVPESFACRCPNVDAIVERINTESAIVLKNAVKADKTEVFALDYDAFGKMLKESAQKTEEQFARDEATESEVKRYLLDRELYAQNVFVYGTRKKILVLENVDLASFKRSAEALQSDLSRICGMRLSAPCFTFEGEGGKCVNMTLEGTRRFEIEYAKCTSKSARGEANGDAGGTFSAEDCFYALIADGMGSGREAALTSGVCAFFIEKMITAGNSRALTLRMLNHFVREKNLECSSTVDLAELDLVSGEGRFLKSGAAPSFVKRGPSIFKLRSKTAPIGILRAIDAEEIKFTLEDSDVVVMCSDGVVGGEDCPWLLDLLASELDESPEHTAKRILAEATKRAERPDDMTVLVMRVRARE